MTRQAAYDRAEQLAAETGRAVSVHVRRAAYGACTYSPTAYHVEYYRPGDEQRDDHDYTVRPVETQPC